jgi:heat shock protein HtpX
MGKRILLFVVTNLAIMVTLSIVLGLLGVSGYVLPGGGLDYTALMIFCFVWGMGGAFISLLMSRWIAKRAMGVELVDGRTGTSELDWLYNTVARQAQAANLPMPEVGVYDSPEVNAFATGPSRRKSLVAVSSGLLRGIRAWSTPSCCFWPASSPASSATRSTSATRSSSAWSSRSRSTSCSASSE